MGLIRSKPGRPQSGTFFMGQSDEPRCAILEFTHRREDSTNTNGVSDWENCQFDPRTNQVQQRFVDELQN